MTFYNFLFFKSIFFKVLAPPFTKSEGDGGGLKELSKGREVCFVFLTCSFFFQGTSPTFALSEGVRGGREKELKSKN